MDNEKEGFPIRSLWETRILQLLKHENVVNLNDICRTKATANNRYRSTFYLMFYFCEHGLAGLLSNINILLRDMKAAPRTMCPVDMWKPAVSWPKCGPGRPSCRAPPSSSSSSSSHSCADPSLRTCGPASNRSSCTERCNCRWDTSARCVTVCGRTSRIRTLSICLTSCSLWTRRSAPMPIPPKIMTFSDEPVSAAVGQHHAGSAPGQ